MSGDPMLALALDPRSSVPAYVTLQQQVRLAMRIGTVRPGDQLPPAARSSWRWVSIPTLCSRATGSWSGKA